MYVSSGRKNSTCKVIIVAYYIVTVRVFGASLMAQMVKNLPECGRPGYDP